jgi:serine/threonine-protein kinase
LYWQSADGTGTADRLTTSFNAQFPTSISPDDAHVAMYSGGGTGGAPAAMAISVVELNSASPPEQRRVNPLIQTGAVDFNPEISPDGRWIAYQSNLSGRFQIYVQPFPNVEGLRKQISPLGGTRPAWSRNGRELFYLDGDDMLTSVSVQATEKTFSAGNSKKILSTRYYAGFTTRGNDLRAYDVSADGQKFLMIKDAAPSGQTSTPPPPGMVVVLNWFEELKARVPAK